MNRVKIILVAFAVSLMPMGGIEAQSNALSNLAAQPDILNESLPSPFGIWFGLDAAGIDIKALFEDEPKEVQIMPDTLDKAPLDIQDGPKAEIVQKKTPEAKQTKKQAAEKKRSETTVSPVSSKKVTVTAYSSTVDQTDSTPCITANGFNVCDHDKENIVAANFLPFGTRVRMPELYGDKIFTVQDRMNRRYSYHVDIWMKTREKAKKFGVKYTTVEIVPEQVALAD